VSDVVSITYDGVQYTMRDLGELPMSELTSLHNRLANDMHGNPVDRFASKAIGMKRTWDYLRRTLPVDQRPETVPEPPAEEEPAQGYIPEDHMEATEVEVKETLKTEAFPEETPKKTGGASNRRKRDMYFTFPVKSEIKAARPGTLRHRVLEKMLSNGLMFDEVVNEVKLFDEERRKAGVDMKGSDSHPERRAYEVVRLIHYYLGYGLKQDADGRIRAYGKKE